MNLLAEISVFVLQTISYLYIMIVLLRFLFQLVRADFYNPLSQAVVKLTNPLLLPIRKVVPGVFGIDLACLLLALVLQCLVFIVITLMSGQGMVPPLLLIFYSLIRLLAVVVDIYFWGLLIMVIASWVAPQSYHPALLLLRQLMEPLLMPIRRLLPPMGGLDFSPLIGGMLLFIAKNMLLPALTLSVVRTFG
ncbi:YggT family protein [Exilibacterium tricleocarpae]|uniref:YggT family protein n=1 Tax=Exilibacterium tricleocarpae TaxID=2591008 RepID=A0A545SXD0_9GAMM|nr:YggT family protein [Exilibacterium tricleocarpae]TQV69625.1 YggT family protein [Exilibacterium tricleocarpae]